MNKWWPLIMALVIAFLPVYALAQQAATPSPPPHEHPVAIEGKTDAGMMEKHKDWQAKHENMMAEMKAMDARLDEKLAAMNAAKGDQKVEAMAAVINELVSQRKAMRENLGGMHHEMKGPMMGQSGVEDCPMMKHHGGMQADMPKKAGTQ
jgi:hypothetical protein